MGMGPMTGWGRGRCAPTAAANQSFVGRGFGRFGGWGGRSRGRGWWGRSLGFLGFNSNNYAGPEEEKSILKDQATMLQQELEAIQKRVSELEKTK
jgi:hypothetical protein